MNIKASSSIQSDQIIREDIFLETRTFGQDTILEKLLVSFS